MQKVREMRTHRFAQGKTVQYIRVHHNSGKILQQLKYCIDWFITFFILFLSKKTEHTFLFSNRSLCNFTLHLSLFRIHNLLPCPNLFDQFALSPESYLKTSRPVSSKCERLKKSIQVYRRKLQIMQLNCYPGSHMSRKFTTAIANWNISNARSEVL